MAYYFPLSYLYKTRIGGSKALVYYVLLEYASWGAFLYFFHGVAWLWSFLAQSAFLSGYEIFYLRNDLSNSSQEAGGNRAPTSSVNVIAFVAVRMGAVAIFFATAFLLAQGFSWGVMALALLFGYGVFGLHNFFSARRSRLRLMSFAVLALLKYLPAIVAFLPFSLAMLVVFELFACYGVFRVLEYTARKIPDEISRRFPLRLRWGRIQLLWFLALIPWVFWQFLRGEASWAFFWSYYLGFFLLLRLWKALKA